MSIRIGNNIVAGSGGGAWGQITGTLQDQTDLKEVLDEKATEAFVNSSINALAAFPITRNAAKDPFRTRGELLNATTYYSGGEERVPTRNDYAFVQSDEYYGTAVDGYTDFALTEEYVGYYVLDGYDKTMVTTANKDSLGIVPGTTVPYVELPSTRYIYNGTGFEFQFIVNQHGLTAVQLATLNSGITASKVAQYDGYATGKADLVGGKVPEEQLQSLTSSKKGIARVNSSYGITVGSNALLMTQKASTALINAHSDHYAPIVPDNLFYAVRSVSPNITTIPADAASVDLYDASATNNNHSYIYRHTPETAPTYKLPAVTDSTVSHQIDLTVTFSSTALSAVFQDAEGTAITPKSTPTIQTGTVIDYLCEYIAGEWVVMPLVIKE